MSENKTTKRTAAGLALIAVVIVAGALLLVDPLGWHLLDKASGLRDDAAGAMPPGVGVYAGIDLRVFIEEALTEFSQKGRG